MRRIYLDYAATTPVDPAVLAAMKPYFSGSFGNPSSLHSYGQEASRAVFAARRAIGAAIGADYKELIFTGSATEANNLALRGVIRRIMNYESGIMGKKTIIRDSKFITPRIIVSSIEHESILETARDLEAMGVEVIMIPVSHEGIINLEKLRGSLNERTILVSVVYASNAVGTIQPISEISNIIRNFRESRIQDYGLRGNLKTMIHNSSFMLPLFHTDAAQAFQYLDCDVNRLGADMMTLSAHKIYGPKGIGALYMRQNYESGIRNYGTEDRKSLIHNSKFIIHSLVTGGGQEFGIRSGTENVPYIVGFARAVEIAAKARAREAERTRALRDKLFRGIKKILPKAAMNGSPLKAKRLPNHLNVYLPGYRAGELLIALDRLGVAVSSGPACASRAPKPPGALLALGIPEERAASSLRISLGRGTTMREIDRMLRIFNMLLLKSHV